jgi:hypothetical protein
MRCWLFYVRCAARPVSPRTSENAPLTPGGGDRFGDPQGRGVTHDCEPKPEQKQSVYPTDCWRIGGRSFFCDTQPDDSIFRDPDGAEFATRGEQAERSMADPPLSPDRLDILRLRARVVTLERAVLAALELALRIRPEELESGLETARHLLEGNYQHLDFATDVVLPAERAFLSQEVERLMRALQAEMGFSQGIHADEEG